MGGEWKDGLFHHFKVTPTKINQNQINPSLWASGGQGIFDRAKWLELGGMDLIYHPFYWEDTDMGYRAWKRGWQVLWAPECQVTHDHKASVISSNFSDKSINYTAQRNQFLFVWKNISDSSFLWSHLLHLLYYLFKYPSPVFGALLLLPVALRARAKERVYWKRTDRDILTAWTR
jgi:GT2 family glycosyltransferase